MEFCKALMGLAVLLSLALPFITLMIYITLLLAKLIKDEIIKFRRK